MRHSVGRGGIIIRGGVGVIGDADDHRFLAVALGQRAATALKQPLVIFHILTVLAGLHRLLKPRYHVGRPPYRHRGLALLLFLMVIFLHLDIVLLGVAAIGGGSRRAKVGIGLRIPVPLMLVVLGGGGLLAVVGAGGAPLELGVPLLLLLLRLLIDVLGGERRRQPRAVAVIVVCFLMMQDHVDSSAALVIGARIVVAVRLGVIVADLHTSVSILISLRRRQDSRNPFVSSVRAFLSLMVVGIRFVVYALLDDAPAEEAFEVLGDQ